MIKLSISLKFLFVLSSIAIGSKLSAQNRVTGEVADSLTGKPLPFVTINLRDSTNKILQSTSTDTNGIFHFIVGQSVYRLQFSSVGYADKQLGLNITNLNIDLGIIKLSEKSNLLTQVTIQAKKNPLTFEPGRINYIIGNDPRTEGKNGLEILRYAPLISVGDGQSIKLNGQTNFLILLNGKPNAALSSNLADFLQSFDSKQIERIEVITQPSAKYSAEGIGGIINVVTKKTTVNGTFGGVAAGSDSYYSSYINANLSGRDEKFGYSAIVTKSWFRNGTYDYLLDQNFGNQHNYIFGNSTPKRTLLNLSMQFSYDFSAKSVLNVDLSNFSGNGKILQNYNRGGDLLTSINNIENNNISIGGDYEYKITKSSSVVVSYKYNHLKDHTVIELSDPNLNNNGNVNRTIEHIIQLDYKVNSLEMGGRASLRNFNSNYNNNIYKFNQDIYAAYLNYSKKVNSFNFQTGLRGESSEYMVSQSRSNQFNLFPSIAVDKSFSPSKINLEFAYSMRISRPQLYYLSPFANNANPYFVTTGNPLLASEISQNFELRLTKEQDNGNNHIIMFTYNHNNRPISNFLSVQSDTVVSSMYLNLNGQNTFGVSINSNLSLPQKLSLTFSSNLYLTDLQKSVLNTIKNINIQYDNKGVYGNIELDLAGTIHKVYRFSLTNSYNIRDIYLQGYGTGFFYQDINVNRTFFNQLRVTLSIRQPFIKDYSYKQTYPDLYQQAVNTTPQQRIFLGVRYAFGKTKKATTRTRTKAADDDKKTKNSLDNIK